VKEYKRLSQENSHKTNGQSEEGKEKYQQALKRANQMEESYKGISEEVSRLKNEVHDHKIISYVSFIIIGVLSFAYGCFFLT